MSDAEVRNAALEEAALECERRARLFETVGRYKTADGADMMAESIRRMKSAQTPTPASSSPSLEP